LKFSSPLEEALAHRVSVAHRATLVDLYDTDGGRPEVVRTLSGSWWLRRCRGFRRRKTTEHRITSVPNWPERRFWWEPTHRRLASSGPAFVGRRA
jgi:hypothetical protein